MVIANLERALGIPIDLQKGAEIKLPPRLLLIHLGLRQRILKESSLHPTIPDYIQWDQYNKNDGVYPKDLRIVDDMAQIIAYVFGPTKPTHLFGIMDAGEDITRAVGYHLKIDSENIIFSRKLKGDPDNFREPYYVARSYKSSLGQTNNGQGIVHMSSYFFPKGSRVLVVDDVAALFGAGGPTIEDVQKQGVKVVGFVVGLGKMHQGWGEELQELNPPVPGFPVISVDNIEYENGNRRGPGKIILTNESQALKIL